MESIVRVRGQLLEKMVNGVSQKKLQRCTKWVSLNKDDLGGQMLWPWESHPSAKITNGRNGGRKNLSSYLTKVNNVRVVNVKIGTN